MTRVLLQTLNLVTIRAVYYLLVITQAASYTRDHAFVAADIFLKACISSSASGKSISLLASDLIVRVPDRRYSGCIAVQQIWLISWTAGLEKARIKGKVTIAVPQLLEGSACGAFLDATVEARFNRKGAYLPKKSKLKLKGKARAPKGTKPRTDPDKWILQCVPNVACPD